MMQYKMEFISLVSLRHSLIPFRIKNFTELIEQARLIENDLMATQQHQDVSRKMPGNVLEDPLGSSHGLHLVTDIRLPRLDELIHRPRDRRQSSPHHVAHQSPHASRAHPRSAQPTQPLHIQSPRHRLRRRNHPSRPIPSSNLPLFAINRIAGERLKYIMMEDTLLHPVKECCHMKRRRKHLNEDDLDEPDRAGDEDGDEPAGDAVEQDAGRRCVGSIWVED
ncbi:hypothetical protein IEQ34_015744 [Dendrobium chrysotoxum]|uniref:Uncharacterized protein n=1 Tax=Dendrobium chrysotoxum TaxID=161865 RepID=A0AAV7GHL1_DENCH|nr:hypothetical protein IEQ34_015744 [Dendrobium chrysotoxum]